MLYTVESHGILKGKSLLMVILKINKVHLFKHLHDVYSMLYPLYFNLEQYVCFLQLNAFTCTWTK